MKLSDKADEIAQQLDSLGRELMDKITRAGGSAHHPLAIEVARCAVSQGVVEQMAQRLRERKL